MEVHRQTCQACGSFDLRNIIVREPGHAEMVYVKCANCAKLVAQYRLSGYYHHGKGVESFLRSVGADATDSARRQLDEFERVQTEALEGYERALKQLEEDGKEI